MITIFILVVLLAVVALIVLNIVSNRSHSNPEVNIDADNDATAESLPMENAHVSHAGTSCPLAITLQVIGVVNAFGGLIFGLVCGSELGAVIAIAVVFSGLMGCLFCFAFAKCVEAADKYLKNR